MPSIESVPEEIRARTEFVAAIRTGIDALMGRCGFSRERAVATLLKELNRGMQQQQESLSTTIPGTTSRPTDDEIFDAMRKHKLGVDEATRAVTVSRAMRREMLSRRDITPAEAIDRLIARISLDNILYESGEDDDSDDDNRGISALNMPKIDLVSSPSSSSLSPSSPSTSSTTSKTTGHFRKNARNKKFTSQSPRKQQKTSHHHGTGNNILVGKKRGMDEMDHSGSKNDDEVETKAATGRPLRGAKRLHRASANASSASSEASTGSSTRSVNK